MLVFIFTLVVLWVYRRKHGLPTDGCALVHAGASDSTKHGSFDVMRAAWWRRWRLEVLLVVSSNDHVVDLWVMVSYMVTVTGNTGGGGRGVSQEAWFLCNVCWKSACSPRASVTSFPRFPGVAMGPMWKSKG